MLWTITIVLVILWAVGLVSSYTMGGWIHCCSCSPSSSSSSTCFPVAERYKASPTHV